METTDRNALEGKLIPELQKIATSLGIEGTQRLRKSGLIDAIVAQGDGNGSAAPSAPAHTGGDADGDGGERPARDRGPQASTATDDRPRSDDRPRADDRTDTDRDQDEMDDDGPQGADRGDRPVRSDRGIIEPGCRGQADSRTRRRSASRRRGSRRRPG